MQLHNDGAALNHIQLLLPDIAVAAGFFLPAKGADKKGLRIIINAEGQIVYKQRQGHQQYDDRQNQQAHAAADACQNTGNAQHRQHQTKEGGTLVMLHRQTGLMLFAVPEELRKALVHRVAGTEHSRRQDQIW